MPIFKSTMFFEGRSHGWTETWWQNSTDTNYLAAMDNLESLAKKRAKLLGKECLINGLRVSREDELNESYLKYVTIKGAAQQPAAAPDVGVLLTVRDDLNKRKKHAFLRGIWDEVETNHGVYLRNFAVWKDSMAEFKAALTGGDNGGVWGWFGVQTHHKRLIANWTVDADDRITIGSDVAFFPNDRIGKNLELNVTGVNGKSVLNRKYIVKVTGADGSITRDAYAHVNRRFGGDMEWVEKGFIQARGAADQRITRRAAGAPLLESHGRRRAKPHG